MKREVIVLTDKDLANSMTIQKAMQRELNLLHQLITDLSCLTTIASLVMSAETLTDRLQHVDTMDQLVKSITPLAFECKKIPFQLAKMLEKEVPDEDPKT